MAGNIKIVGSEGKIYDLILNESIILLTKKDIIFLTLPPSGNNWVLKISFEEGNIFQGHSIKTSTENNILSIRCINWEAESLENVEPLNFNSKDGKTSLYVKIKSSASYDHNRRIVHLSVWKLQV